MPPPQGTCWLPAEVLKGRGKLKLIYKGREISIRIEDLRRLLATPREGP
jgi:hypothetical protein